MRKKRKYSLRVLLLVVTLAAAVCSWLTIPEIRRKAILGLSDADSHIRWLYVESRLNKILDEVDGRHAHRSPGGVRFNLYGSRITDKELLALVRTLEWLPKGDRHYSHFFFLQDTAVSDETEQFVKLKYPHLLLYRGPPRDTEAGQAAPRTP